MSSRGMHGGANLEMRNILVSTPSIGNNVNSLVSIVVNDEIILDATLLVGEEGEDASAGLELSNTGHHQPLDELDSVLSMDAIGIR
jgi:hypothetical protein